MTYFPRHNPVNPEKGGARKLSGGKTPSEIFGTARETRKTIANCINAALQEHGIPQRVDPRSLKARGIKRKAEKRLGVKVVKALTPKGRVAILKARAASKRPT